MASPEEKQRDLYSINKMHQKMLNTLETKNCSCFQLASYSLDVSALSLESELLPYLEQYDKLINALRIRFRSDLKDLLLSVDERDRIYLMDCFEDVEHIAKLRNLEMLPPLDLEAGKAATLGKYICLLSLEIRLFTAVLSNSRVASRLISSGPPE